MNYLKELSDKVNEIYQQSHLIFSSFQIESKLNCLEGCGACCLSKDITASVLEMLPLAFELSAKGIAIETLEKLSERGEKQCLFYQKNSEDGLKGECTVYQYRPIVCRSFGVAAVMDKFGKKRLSVCKYIKANASEMLLEATSTDAPIIAEYAQQISLLDPSIGQRLLPINEAVKEALERVLCNADYY